MPQPCSVPSLRMEGGRERTLLSLACILPPHPPSCPLSLPGLSTFLGVRFCSLLLWPPSGPDFPSLQGQVPSLSGPEGGGSAVGLWAPLFPRLALEQGRGCVLPSTCLSPGLGVQRKDCASLVWVGRAPNPLPCWQAHWPPLPYPTRRTWKSQPGAARLNALHTQCT